MTKTAQAARDFHRYGTEKALAEYRAALEQQIKADRAARPVITWANFGSTDR